jgi:penicillin-binding protein 1A
VYDAPRPDRSAVREAPPLRTSPTPAGWIALGVWTVFAILAFLLAVGAVSAFSRLTQGLPPVSGFDKIGFSEQSVVLDRTGQIELARFGGEQREIVEFKDIPPIVIDAQTAVEDKTFWENSGFDPVAIFAAGLDSLRGNSRGASTITQQLVRQRLLPEDLVQDPHRTLERKLKEIIQSIRLTEAYPGLAGKQQIIAAYLNQNYYGNQAYGVKAAAKSYFNKDLADLTLAEAAILAGMAKSPSNYDLVKNADSFCDKPDPEDSSNCLGTTTLTVPDDSPIVQRRNQILDLLAAGRTTLSGDRYSSADFEAAKHEPVIVAPQSIPRWIAPHFVWAVQQELAEKLCGPDVPTCDELSAGGLRITTTLDTDLQKIAEKWVQAAAVVPNAPHPATVARHLGIPYEQWMKNLRGKDINNGALVAIDYQTGQLVAYVGSANYYSVKSTKQFQAKYDVVGSGFRQPGSAFKPFNYLTAIDDKNLTAASMLMDTATDFGGKYTPSDADNYERGPVRVRTALQFSLNIPSVKTAQINSPDHIFARARDFGMVFASDKTNAGLSIALGVQEVRPVDLVTAYATLANGGKKVDHTTILSVTDQSGKDVPGVPAWTQPEGEQVASPQAAFIVTDILAGNTNPKVNPFWGKFALTGPGKERRPATLKTGTNNDAKDLNAYGFIAPPSEQGRADGEFALAAGAWNGNSDNSVVSPNKPVFSIDVTTFVWQGFMDEASKKWAVNDFKTPDGLAKAKVDPWTGLQPTAGKPSIEEWFIPGTEPKNGVPADMCGDAVLDQPGIYEGRFQNWKQADLDWLARARRGPGTSGGVNGTRTAYFYNPQFQPFGRSWGSLVEGHGCAAPSPSVTCYPVPTPDASGNIPSFEIPTPDPSASFDVIYEPCPTEVPSASPSESPSIEPSIEPSLLPTPSPTPRPTKPPKPTPTLPPLPSPSVVGASAPAPSSAAGEPSTGP